MLYTYLTGWFVCTETYIVDNSEVLLHVKQMKYKLYIIQVEYVNKFFSCNPICMEKLKNSGACLHMRLQRLPVIRMCVLQQ